MIRQYGHVFVWHVIRNLRQHRLLGFLNVATVALGVALYLAIQIANQSANRAFEASVDIVAGRAQLEITSPAGNLPDTAFPKVAHQAGIAAVTPIVRGIISLPDFPGEYLDLLGIDVLTNEPFRTFELTNFQSAQNFDLQGWLRGPRTIAVSENLASRHHWKAGDHVNAQVNGRAIVLTIGFIVRSTEKSTGMDDRFAAMDIGWAQELFSRSGTLDSISVRLTNGSEPAKIAASLHHILPPDVVVNPPARRGEQVERMLGGFQLNLEAMSLVSLLVGMFLIYNTVEASVVRRRNEIGILRSLGATRNEVRWLFLGEAAVLGTIGVLVGIVLGYGLAQILIHAVTETISSLYVLVNVRQLVVTPRSCISALLLGLSSVLLAAWFPAQRAASMQPVDALHGRGTRLESTINPTLRWIAAAALSLSGAFLFSILALWTGPAWLGFAAAFFVLAGFSSLAPEVTMRFSRLAQIITKRRIEPTLAAQNLVRALLRNSITIAALAAAVAMTVGVAVMVFSFRQTVGDWINQTLIADLFIGPATNEVAGPSSFMPPETIDYLEKNPAVEAVDTYREVDLPFRGETISIAVVRGSNRRNLHFLHGANDYIMRRLYNEQCVLVSESFARRFQLKEQQTIKLPTPVGDKEFPVAGIFYDYTRDQGTVFLSAKNFQRFWSDNRVNSLAVYLNTGASAEQVAQDFQRHFSARGEFSIYSNQLLRTRIFEIFDQTFAVTYVLRWIAIVVAVIGIFLGLTTLVTERSRDLGVLRSIGASAGQIRRLLLWESGMIGVLASAIGITSGLCLAVVLTGVINRAFFGWTIQLAFPWESLAWTPIWIIAAALLAGWVPALRAAQLNIAAAVRTE